MSKDPSVEEKLLGNHYTEEDPGIIQLWSLLISYNLE